MIQHKKTGFTFKQFHIHHDNCEMKVGTDGVLLGAWCKISPQSKQILDLGTGTGLIAIMLAQRTQHLQSQIHAIELEPLAYAQAKENMRSSPWAERLFIYQRDIRDFTQKCGQKFDLIVSNPPYFTTGCHCRNEKRTLARYQQNSHFEWLMMAEKCLSDNGVIQFIVPYSEGLQLLTSLKKQTALYCTQYCEVITKQGKAPQRLLLHFSRTNIAQEQTRLTIYNKQNQYHQQFIEITKEFYLKL